MFDKRINVLKQILVKEDLDAVLISAVSNIAYLTGYGNFSKDEREAYLIITKNEQYIITDARYAEAIKKQVPFFTLFERGYKNKTADLFKDLGKKNKSWGIEEDNLTVAEYKLIKKHFKQIKHLDVNQSRTIKTVEEIAKITEACKIGDLAFEFILKKLKLGITEKQIALELENFVKQKGAEFSFPAIVAFGQSSSIPHHQTGNNKLTGSGQFILLDFGVKFENYCSDMTRTIFLGRPSEKQKQIYETVLTAQQKAVDFIKSHQDIKVSDIDQAAREYIISKGFPSIPHSLGHGVGLQVHEYPHLSPKSKEILKEGMVFSIEPGIYLPNFGGVRIEDLYVYQKNGLKKITNSSSQLKVL